MSFNSSRSTAPARGLIRRAVQVARVAILAFALAVAASAQPAQAHVDYRITKLYFSTGPQPFEAGSQQRVKLGFLFHGWTADLNWQLIVDGEDGQGATVVGSGSTRKRGSSYWLCYYKYVWITLPEHLGATGKTEAKLTLRVDYTLTSGSERGKTGSFSKSIKFKIEPDANAPEVSVSDAGPVEATGPDGAVVAFEEGVSATDDRDPNPTIEFRRDSKQGPVTEPGYTFPVGVTTMFARATDAAGNKSGWKKFSVTVEDTTAPEITAPGPITVSTTGDETEAVVTFDVTATDIVDQDVTPQPAKGSKGSGDSFPLGTTTVTYEAVDSSKNQSSASFDVTVVDGGKPTLQMPANITVSTSGDATEVVVTFEVTATDAIDSDVDVAPAPGNKASGDSFPLGDTTVTYIATDDAGNTDEGSFVVTVTDGGDPTISVPGNLSVKTEGDATEAVVTFDVTATDAIDSDVDVAPAPGSKASGDSFPLGDTTVTYIAIDDAGNTDEGSFVVTVADGGDPTITVPGNLSVKTEGDATEAVVTFEVTATDAIDSDVDVAPAPGSKASGDSFPLGDTTVTYIATDDAGNTDEGSFVVTVGDGGNPVVAGPGNPTEATVGDAIDAVVTFEVTATDAIDNNVVAVPAAGSKKSGDSFPYGDTEVTYEATDSEGNVGSTTFTVTVTDGGDPTITMPTVAPVKTSGDATKAVVTFDVTATDAIDSDVEVVPAPGSKASGDSFRVGETTVTYIATDDAGNTDEGEVVIVVEDGGAPTLTVPADISVSTDQGAAGAVVEYQVSATDAVDGDIDPTRTEGPASGSLFPIGTTTVTHIATDSSGNSSEPKSFTVTVTDDEPPVFSASFPGDITDRVEYPVEGKEINWAEPTATDNSGGEVMIEQIAGPTSGSFFQHNTPTTITYKATDPSGVSTEKSFTVTVLRDAPGAVMVSITSPDDGVFMISSSEPQLNGEIPVTGGETTEMAMMVKPGEHSFSVSTPDGFAVTSAECGAGGNIDQETLNADVAVASEGAVSCAIVSHDSVTPTTEVIGALVGARADQMLASRPDVDRRIDRLSGGSTAETGVTAFGVLGPFDDAPFALRFDEQSANFSFSLEAARKKVARARAAANAKVSPLSEVGLGGDLDVMGDGLAVDGGADAQAVAFEVDDEPRGGFDIWVEGSYSQFSIESGDGDFLTVFIGVDYVIGGDILLGVAVQADYIDLDDAEGVTSAAHAEGKGIMVGPYITARLDEQLYLDAEASYGVARNKVSPDGTYVDEFDSERFLVSAAVIGDFKYDAWMFRPEVRFAYYKEETEAYTDSLGVEIPSIDVSKGTLTVAPSIAYSMSLDEQGLTLIPSVTVKGVYTFTSEGGVLPSPADLGAEEGLRGRVETKLSLYSMDEGASVSAGGFFDGLGDADYESWGGELRVSIPLPGL